MKVVLVIIDGLGDRPISELKDQTPLEAANTPNLDYFATNGITGIMNAIDVGIRPGSDTSHLAIFGYDPETHYTGRGIFEAAGIGMELKKGDIALRGNFATVTEDLIIVDRRAGRIENVSKLADALNGMKIDGVRFFVKAGVMHRAGVVLRGSNLSHMVSDNDPHEVGVKVKQVKALDNTEEAKFTASVINKFLEEAHKILKEHEVNKKRRKERLLEANYILLRGASKLTHFEPFEKKYKLKACCIAGAGLYKGIAKVLGMDVLQVKGATGTANTDINAKFIAAKKALAKYDFVFVHIKYADNYAEDGNVFGKLKFIEKIDDALIHLIGIKDTLIVITADHSTPCKLKAHSGDPVPIVMFGEGVRTDKVKEFNERSCMQGGLGRIKGKDLMNEILNLIGKAKLYGA